MLQDGAPQALIESRVPLNSPLPRTGKHKAVRISQLLSSLLIILNFFPGLELLTHNSVRQASCQSLNRKLKASFKRYHVHVQNVQKS